MEHNNESIKCLLVNIIKELQEINSKLDRPIHNTMIGATPLTAVGVYESYWNKPDEPTRQQLEQLEATYSTGEVVEALTIAYNNKANNKMNYIISTLKRRKHEELSRKQKRQRLTDEEIKLIWDNEPKGL